MPDLGHGGAQGEGEGDHRDADEHHDLRAAGVDDPPEEGARKGEWETDDERGVDLGERPAEGWVVLPYADEEGEGVEADSGDGDLGEEEGRDDVVAEVRAFAERVQCGAP